MRGIQFYTLKSVLDFLYHGEANIYQENLEQFLKIAEELKLSGLNGENSNTKQDEPCLKEYGGDRYIEQEPEMFVNTPSKMPNQNNIKPKKMSYNSRGAKSENH